MFLGLPTITVAAVAGTMILIILLLLGWGLSFREDA